MFDAPFVTVSINQSWMSYLLGALNVLRENDFWIESQSQAAIDEVEKLFAALALGNSSGGDMIPVGTIVAYGSVTPPAGWLVCNGTLYENADYPDLFAAIGTGFGSDGSGLRFRVPNLQGRVPVGVDATPGANVGAAFGEDYVTLTGSNIPYHNHEYTEWVNTTLVLESTDPAAVPVINDIGRDINNTTYFGGDGLHENRQPSLTVQYIIKAV